MSQTQKIIELNGRKITLIGTAHVSAESIVEVENAVRQIKPDCVCIELDDRRLDSLKNKENYKNLDIIAVLKRHEGFMMFANIILASYQKRMGKNSGVNPGDEMLAAIRVADELNIPAVMVDRPIQITLKRAWSTNSFWGKCNLLATLVSSAFSKEEVSAQDIENLKNSSEMDSMMDDMAKEMPVVKKVLIDERNSYLATKIWESTGSNIVAVLGAAHLPGVIEELEKLAAEDKDGIGSEKRDAYISEISAVPPKSAGGKIIGWILPILIILLIGLGFYYGGKTKGLDMTIAWCLWNGILAGIFTLIAGGHPLTILAAVVGAPVTSLCPVVGVGMLTGIVQALVKKPKVADMETAGDDANSLKGWYKNRILNILLIFILSSIGSSIGTFVAGADFVLAISEMINNFR